MAAACPVLQHNLSTASIASWDLADVAILLYLGSLHQWRGRKPYVWEGQGLPILTRSKIDVPDSTAAVGGGRPNVAAVIIYSVIISMYNVISVPMGPERRSGPFKTTRLMVKLYQAYVLASEGLAR